jgi:hypothetical protein
VLMPQSNQPQTRGTGQKEEGIFVALACYRITKIKPPSSLWYDIS